MKRKDHFLHKHGYGFLFRDPEYMKRLIRDFVDRDFFNQLDFSDCEPLLEKTYLTDEYREFAEDLVFKIRLRGKVAYVYILVEFQSTPDKFISVRILNYLSLFYLDFIKEFKQANDRLPESLPPVLPLMLYNGEDPWNVPDNVRDLIQYNEFLQPFYPDFKYFKIIAREYSTKQLREIGSIVSSVFLVERFGKDELSRISESLKDVLAKEDLRVLSIFVVWLRHLLLNKRLDESAFYEALSIRNKKETKSMLVDTIHTWGEEIRREAERKGKKDGKKEGIKEQALKTAKNLLALNNMTIEQIAGVTGLRLEEVKKL